MMRTTMRTIETDIPASRIANLVKVGFHLYRLRWYVDAKVVVNLTDKA
jgi:hypothetical protein